MLVVAQSCVAGSLIGQADPLTARAAKRCRHERGGRPRPLRPSDSRDRAVAVARRSSSQSGRRRAPRLGGALAESARSFSQSVSSIDYPLFSPWLMRFSCKFTLGYPQPSAVFFRQFWGAPTADQLDEDLMLDAVGDAASAISWSAIERATKSPALDSAASSSLRISQRARL